MEKKVIIKLNKGCGISLLTFRYPIDKTKERVLNADWTIDVIKQGDKDKQEKEGRVMSALNLSPAMILEYSYETEPKNQTAEDRLKKLAFETFFPGHFAFTVNGVAAPTCSVPLFDLYVPSDVVSDRYALKKVRASVDELLESMEAEELRDVCYFIGVTELPKTPEEMIMYLSDGDAGAISKDLATCEKFLEAWTESEGDKQILVAVKKAIAYGIINKEGGANNPIYYLNNANLGDSVSSIVAWCKGNEKTYQLYIVEKIIDHEQDWKPGTMEQKKFSVEAEKAAESLTDEKHQEYIKAAKELQAEGYLRHTLNFETMNPVNCIDLIAIGKQNKRKGFIVNTIVKKKLEGKK